MPINNNNLGNKVTTRTISWLNLVQRAWGAEWRAPDHGVYTWSNGRKFDSTDQSQGGVYDQTQIAELQFDHKDYPDMPEYVLAEDGTVVGMG